MARPRPYGISSRRRALLNLKFWSKSEIKPAIFELHREFDKSGISGIGHVLDGVVFPGGITVVCWKSENPSVTVFNSFRQFEKVHLAFHGKSKIVWIDGFDGAGFMLRYLNTITQEFKGSGNPLVRRVQTKATEIERLLKSAKKLTIEYDREGENTLLKTSPGTGISANASEVIDSTPEEQS